MKRKKGLIVQDDVEEDIDGISRLAPLTRYLNAFRMVAYDTLNV